MTKRERDCCVEKEVFEDQSSPRNVVLSPLLDKVIEKLGKTQADQGQQTVEDIRRGGRPRRATERASGTDARDPRRHQATQGG